MTRMYGGMGYDLRLGQMAIGASTGPPPFVNLLSTQTTHAAQNSVNFGNIFDKSGSTSFSISVWLKANDLNTSGDILGKLDPTNAFGYELQILSSGKLDWSIIASPGSTYLELDTGVLISISTWYHIVIVSTGTTPATNTCYVNAVAKTFSTTNNNFSGSASNTGSLHTAWRPSIGADIELNQLSLWNIALSSANVTALYNSGTPPNVMTLGIGTPAGYWYLGSGDNATATNGFVDHSGNNLSGTGINTPVFVSDVP
jgi:Concanavalin A-like lectin/glucanases superfamily